MEYANAASLHYITLPTPANAAGALRRCWEEAGLAASRLAAAPGPRRSQPPVVVMLSEDGETLENAEQLYEAVLENGARIITSEPRTLTFVKGTIVSVSAGALHLTERLAA